jgi:hypothetical protein
VAEAKLERPCEDTADISAFISAAAGAEAAAAAAAIFTI